MNNTIAYLSPNLNGWKLHATYSNGVNEDSEKWSRNKHYYGLGATFEDQAFRLGAYWEMLDNKGSDGFQNLKQRICLPPRLLMISGHSSFSAFTNTHFIA